MPKIIFFIVVSFEYVKPAPRNLTGLTVPTAEFTIYDEGYTINLSGSYVIAGGRGGCMTLGKTISNFYL